MPTCLPRWTWLLVLPMVVGGLLLMHGLDAQADHSHADRPEPRAASAAAGVDEHGRGHAAPGDDGHCRGCLVSHAMAACVAIVSAVGGIGIVRSLLSAGGAAMVAAAVVGRRRSLGEQARTPDPPWVRLSVMRC